MDYVLGLQRNEKLVAAVAGPLAEAAARQTHATAATRVYSSLLYQTRTWRRPRYVVAKAEQLGDKPTRASS